MKRISVDPLVSKLLLVLAVLKVLLGGASCYDHLHPRAAPDAAEQGDQ